MLIANSRQTAFLLMTLLLAFCVAQRPLDQTGTGSRNHVTVSQSSPDVPRAQVSRPTTAHRIDRARDDDRLPAGRGNRKQKCSNDDEVEGPPSLSERSRQRRSATWTYNGGSRWARSGRDVVGVGWNKRPRYYREDDASRDWKTNMMRVWGKRSGRPTYGFSRMMLF